MAARTAVVAGTATAVSGRVARRQENKWASQDQQAYDQQQQQAYQQQQMAAPVAAAPQEDPIEKLKELGQLHEQGILTDEEFAAEKAKVLG